MLGDLNEWGLCVGEFLHNLFGAVNEAEGSVDVLHLLVQVGGSLVPSGGDELDLLLHDGLVGSDSDQIGIGWSVWSLASSLVLGGPSQGIDGIRNFLLSESEFVSAFLGLHTIDVVVFALLVPNGEDEAVDVVN